MSHKTQGEILASNFKACDIICSRDVDRVAKQIDEAFAKPQAHEINAPILERIRGYLGNGGLFNPEMMEHDKVRDLIMACRDEIERLQHEKHELLNA